MSLHDELSRLAHAAPPMAVTDAVWGPAQRSRRRRSAAAIAAGAAAVAVIAALVLWVPRALPDAPVASTDATAVPDRVVAVPTHLQARTGDGRWAHDEVTDDLAIGVGAVAYVTFEGLPVVIDATDGTYHLLDLPDFLGNDEFVLRGLGGSGLSIALSPDGRRLAYGYAEIGPTAASAPIPSGIRVVDLSTGAVREIPIPLEEGTQVTRLTWSPDSEWLAWTGISLGSWTAFSMGDSTFVSGRVAPGSTASEALPASRNGSRALTVDDTGVVRQLDRRQVVTIGVDGEPGTAPYRGGLPQFLSQQTAAPSPGGAMLLLGDCCGSKVTLLDTTTRSTTTIVLPAPAGDPVDAEALGWLEDDLGVVRTARQYEEDGALVLVDVRGDVREVAQVAGDVPPYLSVAVDLMSPEQPTVSRPGPDWPWSQNRLLLTGAILVALGVAAAALIARWSRRRSPHPLG